MHLHALGESELRGQMSAGAESVDAEPATWWHLRRQTETPRKPYVCREKRGGAMTRHTADGPRSLGLERKVTLVGLALVALAVIQELRKPADSRGWHGELFGFIPYDFRPPTFERVRRTLWAPEEPHLFVPRTLGLGWSVNFARVATVVRRLYGGTRN